MEPAFSESGFDMMVVDEASMMPIPYAMCMGMFGRQHFVVAGDFRQLGPIAISQTRHALDWLHRDLFALSGITATASHPALQMLVVQRRMHPDICSLVNGPFYLGKLKTATAASTTAASSLGPLKGRPVTLVELLSSEGSAVEQTSGHSRVNFRSAEVTTALVQRLLASDSSSEIGIVTPYRGQVSEIKRRLKELDLPREQHQRVKVGTVHAFQGSEADVIVWDLVDTRESRVGRLYHGDSGDRLCNVAISRAKGKLIIVGDPDAFLFAPGREMVKETRNILAREFVAGRGNRVPAEKIIRCRRVPATGTGIDATLRD
jgi:superfamily I DNA and/or RNA helicase